MERTAVAINQANDGRNCANCRYLASAVGPSGAIVRMCRRFPPTPVGGIIQQGGQVAVMASGQWPQIDQPAECWCGEFVAKMES